MLPIVVRVTITVRFSPTHNAADSTCSSASCVLGCDSGWSDCDSTSSNGCEVNTSTDHSNCGTCGSICSIPNANSHCQTGTCTFDACQGSYMDCDSSTSFGSNGCEVDLDSDNNNCGACGTVCTIPNADADCQSGTCTFTSCQGSYHDCDGNIGFGSNGCEIDLNSDNTNCGTCGHDCSALPHVASSYCNGGACVIDSCQGAFIDCNEDPSDGCEIDTSSDAYNCGGCGTDCTALSGVNVTVCSSSVCQINSCLGSHVDCDSNSTNGCEINTSIDNNNCGTCGTICSIPNANATCSNSTCNFISCNQGYFDCDGLSFFGSNGCESSASELATDNDNWRDHLDCAPPEACPGFGDGSFTGNEQISTT
eukprot:TRINITY_DN606_c0_g1_i4.p1 TRINITY_DN606_c0_g1~~TRINITY_DN606_c0_g1_i4.p1  ORF type:complete len:366 (+),score=34.88 TRINITY_DN606_c0_g1_i4:1002-2099(+)